MQRRPPSQCLSPSQAMPAPGEAQTEPSQPHAPLLPALSLVLPEDFGLLTTALLLTAAGEKTLPNGRKPQNFLFSSAGESKVIFGPFQYKSVFVCVFFICKSPVSGRLQAQSENQSSPSEYLCLFCLVSILFVFPCLTISRVYLQIVDSSQTRFSSQRK